MQNAGEDGRMIFLYKESLLYIFKYKWNREARRLLTKNSSFVHFNNKKHLLQYRVKYNDETMKI